ncbi:MAG: hypothetical protein KGR26_03100, partial [Cyanobacteria bacterium REEB65]|nr:hypothetical protein [Cyanobacteria bacterium REEB65]
TSANDLVFTRNGSFHYDYFGTGTSGEYRLVDQNGNFVMGLTSNSASAYNANPVSTLPGTPNAPTESTFKDFGSLTSAAFGVDGFMLHPITIQVDNTKGVNSNFNPTFNSQGWVESNSDAPAALQPNSDGSPGHNVSFVALAKFADPQGLQKVDGSTNFQWNPTTAGNIFVGTAASGTGTVGASNTINPGTLEASNASVNTTLPELTIAQKSFSADVKIVQVGNEMIDDINNLVK